MASVNVLLFLTSGLFLLISSGAEAEMSRDERRAQNKANRKDKSCCYRGTKYMYVGTDHQNQQQALDVGMCKRRCSGTPSLMQNLVSPMQCPRRASNSCAPTREIMQRFHLAQGFREVPQIEDCACVNHGRQCQRIPRKQVFYPGSPYEVELDVGTCAGRCSGQGQGCHAVLNKTVAIDGPNGKSLVSLIRRCGCESSCFRAQRLEAVHDFRWNASSGSLQRHTLYVDVGKCVGGCSSNSKTCVVWAKDGLQCLAHLDHLAGSCMPVFDASKAVKYHTQDLKERVLLVVKTCNC